MRRISRTWAPLLGVTLALVATGCGSGASTSSERTATTAAGAGVSGDLTVSAAASLTEAFTRLGEDFERANPGAHVAFNFGSSGTLATQIRQGAPADTFASADDATMRTLVTAGLVDGTPAVFARNKLVIVTEPGNPEHVATLADLANLDVVALCGETVPCGRYAGQVLRDAGVTLPEARVTRGQDVKATLGAVTTGDADAAIVYVTDAEAAGDAVDTVPIPDRENAIAAYPIATLQASGSKSVSRAFVASVTSRRGQATLRRFGFLPAT